MQEKSEKNYEFFRMMSILVRTVLPLYLSRQSKIAANDRGGDHKPSDKQGKREGKSAVDLLSKKQREGEKNKHEKDAA